MTAGCKNELGQPVDWFVALRLPDSRSYWFFEATSTRFKVLPDEIFLQKLFEEIDLRYDSVQLWNDEPPLKKKAFLAAIMSAHDKGVLYRKKDTNSGFYLLHSVPNFPTHNGVSISYVTPTGSNYGQSMICISLKDQSQFSTLIQQILAENAILYFNNFAPISKQAGILKFRDFFAGKLDIMRKPLQTLKFKSLTGDVIDKVLPMTSFRFIVKTKYSQADPFEGILAPLTQSSWITETWGRPYKPDTCNTTQHVINNQQICFGSVCYPSTKDHSKWALSLDISNLVCISGLNHMDSQSKRGGTFVCFTNSYLYTQMRTIASKYSSCS